ncbi:protein of unknown function DUF87 [Thermoanaerobacter italicus Ab9]|uniref:Helicase HerA central domain-containing protein n=1 Tax=Thermoanaerobacter italicus (strain DSM 9252 / Ab9) TaxID=580331 RepID=D3T7N7_THEIA|nr:ATP-binding protein [Thermoanaerobacter italicus]ADD01969.1 protein of unknown function DUF87 [Thermoanaerobacter italicus Ab9]
MSYTPFEWTENLIIGSIDFVSPDEIRILLDIKAPDSLSLNTGNPHPFPRVNSYVLIPVDEGYLVGQVEWITIERAAFPKRQGMKDFGLVDLPFPLRKISVNPLGTLYKKEGNIYNFKRGNNSLPTVGTPVLLPTAKQVEAIVEGDKAKKVKIGTSPFAGDANIYVDPNKLFGRHLAILGNTGSGKSCSVAGLIHWTLEAAQKERENKDKEGIPNARFIVFDPNGEYSHAFNDTKSFVKARVFKVDIGGNFLNTQIEKNALKVPLWFWNSEEWFLFTSASAKIQKPLLVKALRKAKMLNCYNENLHDPRKKYFVEHIEEILNLLKIVKSPKLVQKSEKNIHNQLGKKLDVLLDNLKDKKEDVSELLDVSDEVIENYIESIEESIKNKRKGGLRDSSKSYYFEEFSLKELEQISNVINEIAEKLGSRADVVNEIHNEINEDVPIRFDIVNFIKNLKNISIEESAEQYLEPLIMRIHMLLSNPRLKSIIDDKDEPVELVKWLENYIGGNNAENGNVVIIDLSLVPSEIIYVITAVIARIIFEALQRYRKLNQKPLPTVLVIEEAHTFIKRYRDEEEDNNAAKICTQIFERIAREGRKFGLNLVISSQRPSELSPTVLSQCNTFLLHRLTNERDQEIISKLVPDNLRGLLRELPILPTQMAILLGWATELPVLVRMRDLPESQRPRSDDPDLWDVWVGENEAGEKVERKIDWSSIVFDWQEEYLRKEISLEVENETDSSEAAVTKTHPNIEIYRK